MAWSLVTQPPIAIFATILFMNDLVNHLVSNSLGISKLMRKHRCLYSWMWSEIWLAFVYSKLANSSVSALYITGNWKWFKKTIANSPKVEYIEQSSSMYHFVALPMRVCWNRGNCTESSLKVFYKHHRWNVVTWSPGSSLGLPSKFGMSEGNFVGMGGQCG